MSRGELSRVSVCSFNEDSLHLPNKLLHEFPRVQRRWVHAHAIQAPIPNGVENRNGGSHTVHGGATHVVLNPDLALLGAAVVDDGLLEDRHQGGPERGGGRQARVLYCPAHEKVQICHVRKMLVAVLGVGEGLVCLLG